jgi:hypothetical protein
MVADTSIPWYNVPPRRFPVHLWLERRYGFRVPPLRFVQPASQPEGASDQRERRRLFPAWPNPERPSAPGRRPEGARPFPAKLWLEQRRQQQGG